MGLCRELGKTLEEGLEMSVLEFQLWAAYFKLEQDKQKEIKDNGRRSN
jgi:hypothetical protein